MKQEGTYKLNDLVSAKDTILCLHREQYFVQIRSKPRTHTPYIEAQRLRNRDYKLDLGVGEDDASIDKKESWGGGRKCISDGSASL